MKIRKRKVKSQNQRQVILSQVKLEELCYISHITHEPAGLMTGRGWETQKTEFKRCSKQIIRQGSWRALRKAKGHQRWDLEMPEGLQDL